MTLAINHRPKGFKSFSGNESTVNALKTVLERDLEDIPHAFLFTGPSGCGKTTLARIVSNYLECSPSEFNELNAADFRGIDTVREVIRTMRYKPMSGDVRIWLFDEVHKQSNDAQNAMLKMLEDAPKHVYFVLCTTDPQKLISTLKGRCTAFEVKSLSTDEMMELLSNVVKKEKKEVPDKVLRRIAIDSNGSPRNALQILERIIDLSIDDMEKAAKETESVETEAIELCSLLMDERANWSKVAEVIKGLDGEAESIRYAVLGYCNSILLKGKPNKRAFLIMQCFRENFYNLGKNGITMAAYDVLLGE